MLQVDALDKLGQTPLHLALRNKNMDVVELLLTGDANPNLADSEGLTPLHIICKNYRYNIIHMCQFANQQISITPLYMYDSVKMIFELSNNRHQPVKVNARDNLGYTPSLHLSLNNQYCKFHETVELLLTRGADPNMANEEGLTLLHIFCTEANHDLMTMFFNIIDQGNQVAQIEARDNEGNTPLHLALKYNSDKCNPRRWRNYSPAAAAAAAADPHVCVYRAYIYALGKKRKVLRTRAAPSLNPRRELAARKEKEKKGERETRQTVKTDR
uniref:Uncharacterized protein n=1 Tax=Trichogramma kaykai TaxID=54128 RepID=A0ABD2WJW0_9HYME